MSSGGGLDGVIWIKLAKRDAQWELIDRDTGSKDQEIDRLAAVDFHFNCTDSTTNVLALLPPPATPITPHPRFRDPLELPVLPLPRPPLPCCIPHDPFMSR